MPFYQQIEQGHRVTHTALEILPDLMHHFLEMTHQGQHRQHCLNDHPVIPHPTLTNPQVGGMPIYFGKGFICEDDHFTLDAVDHVLESRTVINVGRVAVPVDDQAQMIQQQTQLSTDNPAFVGQSGIVSYRQLAG